MTSPPAADGRRPIRRALVSVSDKTGLDDLAKVLHANRVEIVSTGSTARAIQAAGAEVVPVESVTGFPESLDGRVKTLHPAVHAGLLADLRREHHVGQLASLGIAPFDLLVVNLYPFLATVQKGAGFEEIIEQIDIGGPALVRAAAKNHANVAVVVDPARYGDIAVAIGDGGFTSGDRRRLAAAAFAHTATYDIAVASWLGSQSGGDGLPPWLGVAWERVTPLRYGENPHQVAALYRLLGGMPGLADADLLHGKAMSYTNYVDADAAVRAAHDHADPAVAIIKHANPCGIAVADSVAEAYRRAFDCDPVSAFGGVVATNRPLTLESAERIAPVFTEVVVAPDYEPAALDVLRTRPTTRLLRMPGPAARPAVEFRPIAGGGLLQSGDRIDASGDDPATWTRVAGPAVDEPTWADLAFAWRAVRAVTSNAILLARDRASVGIGMGQVNRVDACRLAVERAGPERAAGAVGASDAFFPFPDGLAVLAAAGVRAVVQPGGSMRDDSVIETAAAAGMTMYLTGVRHFAH